MPAANNPPKSKVLFAWPESADELLRALKSYARLQAEFSAVEFEFVLFGHTLPSAAIEIVVSAEDCARAAEDVYVTYLNALD